jgi:hypothetical protein
MFRVIFSLALACGAWYILKDLGMSNEALQIACSALFGVIVFMKLED